MVKFILAALTLLVTAFLGAIAAFDLFDAYMERLKARGPVGEFLHNLILSQGLRVLLFIVAVILIYWGIRENLKLRRHVDPKKLAELEGKQWHETARYDLTEGKPLLETKNPTAHSEYDAAREELQPQEAPNLVFKAPEYLYGHIEYGILVEGRDRQHINEKMIVVTIPVENEFSDEFKAADVSGVTAQVFYQPNDAGPLRVNRGAWLNNGNRSNFQVNDTKYLIIAFFLEGGHRFVAAPVKEYQDNDDALIGSSELLTENYYRVRVRLISEVLGKKYCEQEYDLEIDEDPVHITLIPHVELSASEIRQRLERFLKEGNDLLLRFPKQQELTSNDLKSVDTFEGGVTKFLARCPERFSVATFLSNVPVEKYDGLAHANNWPSLNRLTTRIARLRDMVEEMRRA